MLICHSPFKNCIQINFTRLLYTIEAWSSFQLLTAPLRPVREERVPVGSWFRTENMRLFETGKVGSRKENLKVDSIFFVRHSAEREKRSHSNRGGIRHRRKGELRRKEESGKEEKRSVIVIRCPKINDCDCNALVLWSLTTIAIWKSSYKQKMKQMCIVSIGHG